MRWNSRKTREKKTKSKYRKYSSGVKKEVYPTLSMIMKRDGFIKLEGGRIRVRLRRFKNPEIDYAARHLCEDLNQMKPFALDKFQLPIHYEVV